MKLIDLSFLVCSDGEFIFISSQTFARTTIAYTSLAHTGGSAYDSPTPTVKYDRRKTSNGAIKINDKKIIGSLNRRVIPKVF